LIQPYKYEVIIGGLNYIVGGIMIIIGLALALWTVCIQIKRGLGTPIPVLPPEKLLMTGPYGYCRNPMAFGTYFFYFGICFCLGTLSSFSILVLFIIILNLYIKIREGPNLEKRFGQGYTEYKRHTPFMIPKILGKRWYFLFLH
jgi:protein-S-isoprenylcysteine O-methyltransferase Ste14